MSNKSDGYTDRDCLEAIAYQARVGCAWNSLPDKYPYKIIINKKKEAWIKKEIFPQIVIDYLKETSEEELFQTVINNLIEPINRTQWIDDESFLEAIAYRATKNCPWRVLPRQYPRQYSILRKVEEWNNDGSFAQRITQYLTATNQLILKDLILKSPLNLEFHTQHLKLLTPIQEEVLTGLMLGDGCLTTRGESSLYVERTATDFKYLEWTADIFKNYMRRDPYTRDRFDQRTQKTYHSAIMQTRCSPVFTAWRKKWYPDGKKIIPASLRLTPLTLAVWVADDAQVRTASSLQCLSDCLRVTFATNGFSVQEAERLTKMLSDRYNQRFITYQSKSGPLIEGADNPTRSLVREIDAHFPPGMERKTHWRQFDFKKDRGKYQDIDYLKAIAYQAKTGTAWTKLPKKFPTDSVMRVKKQRWIDQGSFEKRLKEYLTQTSQLNLLPTVLKNNLNTPPGANRISDNTYLEAILYQAKSGCKWTELPSKFPNRRSILNRRRSWNQTGVFTSKVQRYLKETNQTHMEQSIFVNNKKLAGKYPPPNQNKVHKTSP